MSFFSLLRKQRSHLRDSSRRILEHADAKCLICAGIEQSFGWHGDGEWDLQSLDPKLHGWLMTLYWVNGMHVTLGGNLEAHQSSPFIFKQKFFSLLISVLRTSFGRIHIKFFLFNYIYNSKENNYIWCNKGINEKYKIFLITKD